MFDLLLKKRSRAVWHDPHRTVLTLESFSRTELDGGKDIVAAIPKVKDEELRTHMRRHADEELRHAEMFRHRAAELRKSGVVPPATDDKAYDLSRGRSATEVDAHGFFTSGLLDEMGEVAYVAMVYEAEKRAAKLFKMHRDLTTHDPVTCKIFEDILRDENYHVAYTQNTLDRWKKEGRGAEVRRALKEAKSSRFWSAWKRLGARAGNGFSRVLLTVMYFTVLLPFGLISSLFGRPAGGYKASGRPSDLNLQF